MTERNSQKNIDSSSEDLPPYTDPLPVTELRERLVAMYPGLITVTFTLLSATSARSESKKPWRACFEAV